MQAGSTAPIFSNVRRSSAWQAIFRGCSNQSSPIRDSASGSSRYSTRPIATGCWWSGTTRSEEHTSELQSRLHLVCRLLLEKKKELDLNTLLQLQLVHAARDGPAPIASEHHK